MKRFLFLSLLSFLAFSLSVHSQEQEKIVEKVDVIHVAVPVRVFYKGETVAGLSKEDFQLFENGKEVEIQGFNQYSKTIQLKTREEVVQKPRLFFLIFNISDYNNYLADEIDAFFEKILRPQDRLVIMTNHFALGNHMVTDLDQEKARLKRVLDIETKRIRLEILSIEERLKSIYRSYQLGGDEYAIRVFFRNYLDYLEGFREVYFNLNTNELVEMSNYLEGQNLDKWVINFYQLGMFHEPTDLLKIIEEWDHDPYNPYRGLYLEVLQQIQSVGDSSTLRDLAKLFLHSGATFHTLLLRTRSFRTLSQGFDYRPVGSPSEHILREITNMTGGTTGSMKVEQFLEKIVNKEDIYYMLTYVSETSSKKKSKVSLKINRRGHRVIYDNQKRPQHLQTLKRTVRPEAEQHFKLAKVNIQNRLLSFWVSGAEIRSDGSTSQGEVEFRIQIIDDSTKIKFQRQRTTKVGISNFEVNIRLDRTKLSPGEYTMILEAVDQIGQCSDLALVDFTIKGKDK